MDTDALSQNTIEMLVLHGSQGICKGSKKTFSAVSSDQIFKQVVEQIKTIQEVTVTMIEDDLSPSTQLEEGRHHY